MTVSVRRVACRVAAACILSLLPAVIAAGAAPKEAAAPSQIDAEAEVFPLEAEAYPEVLQIGVGPEGFGSTPPVFVRGRTLPAGVGRVAFSVAGPETEFGGPIPVAAEGTIPVLASGKFDGAVFTPKIAGDYTITLIAPDGKGRAELKVVVNEQPDFDQPDSTIDKAAKSADDAADALLKAIEAMPPSPAKDDALPKLKAAKAAVAALAASRAPETAVPALIGAIRKDPDLTRYAGKRMGSMANELLRLRAETKRVKDLTSRFTKAAIGCHQLAFASEFFKAISALLNVKRSLIAIASGLSKDILADFAGNAAKAKGAGPTLAFAVGQITKNAPELNRARDLANNAPGLLADLGGFLSDTAFSTYCEQFVGPVRARMEAHFFQPQEWWNYSFKITGRLILIYPKNAKGRSVPLNGRIEGIAHSFETREDALSVMFPKLMAKTIQKKAHFPPLEIGETAAEMAVLGNEATSGYIEGSGATLALPNSFLLDVTGVLEEDSLSVVLGNAKTDFKASHRVGVLLISPLVLVPVFTWYDLPFQTAHHVFLRASQGQAMRLKLTRAGKKMIAEGTFVRPAPTSGGSRGAYTATIKACNPSC